MAVPSSLKSRKILKSVQIPKTTQSAVSEWLKRRPNVPEESDCQQYSFDLDRLRNLIRQHSSGLSTRTPESHGGSDNGDDTRKMTRVECVYPFVLGDLPMTFPFTSDYIYVRECYLVYYDLINACLANGEIWFVSLTGTPGIGYFYFFERY